MVLGQKHGTNYLPYTIQMPMHTFYTPMTSHRSADFVDIRF